MELFQVVRSVFLVSVLLGSQACASDAIVRTKNGDVRGETSEQGQSFRAIPYAAPPVGALRWMPPQEPANWSGILDAFKFSSECPQKLPKQAVSGSEDCLYLNVFKPVSADGLPVIVFIHGGSNVRGSAGQTGHGGVHLFDGSRLSTKKNVVVVTLNYRLGALGFIAHPKLTETSGYGGSGNYAYMDQIQALKWVQRNIAAFGGDPGNVTLFGHSAGAKGIWVHLTSPLSKGLFHRAIVHSAVREGARSREEQEKHGKTLSQQLGCSNAPDELACMRSKPAKDVVEAMDSGPGSGLYGAVVDGRVLEDAPIAIMTRGEHHHVPILQGNVAEEMSILGLAACFGNFEGLTCPKSLNTESDYKKAVERYAASIKGASASELLRLYQGSAYPSFHKAYDAIRADREYLCPARRVLRAVGAKQTEFVGRFYYTHTYSSGPHGPESPTKDGPSHGYELLFIFNSLGAAGVKSPTKDEVAMVETFQDMWSSFAKTGVPPAPWAKYDSQKDNYIVFGATVSQGERLREEQCKLWDNLPPL